MGLAQPLMTLCCLTHMSSSLGSLFGIIFFFLTRRGLPSLFISIISIFPEIPHTSSAKCTISMQFALFVFPRLLPFADDTQLCGQRSRPKTIKRIFFIHQLFCSNFHIDIKPSSVCLKQNSSTAIYSGVVISVCGIFTSDMREDS